MLTAAPAEEDAYSQFSHGIPFLKTQCTARDSCDNHAVIEIQKEL
jgi:hypothetical protein